MKKKIKRALEWILFIVAGTGPIARKAVHEGLCDFSGQGKTNTENKNEKKK